MTTETEIQTERLRLSPLAIEDKTFILALVNTEGWLQFIGDRNVHSEKDAVAYIKKILSQPQITYWIVREKQNNIPIGVITFIKRDYLDHPDIGFAFLPQFSNQGYAVEATKAILDILLNQRMTTILAITKPGNERSIRLLEKLEFKFLEEKLINNEAMQVYQFSGGHNNGI